MNLFYRMKLLKFDCLQKKKKPKCVENVAYIRKYNVGDVINKQNT